MIIETTIAERTLTLFIIAILILIIFIFHDIFRRVLNSKHFHVYKDESNELSSIGKLIAINYNTEKELYEYWFKKRSKKIRVFCIYPLETLQELIICSSFNKYMLMAMIYEKEDGLYLAPLETYEDIYPEYKIIPLEPVEKTSFGIVECPECKFRIDNDSIYCHECGEKLIKEKLSDYFPEEKSEIFHNYNKDKIERFGCENCEDALWDDLQKYPEVYGCGLVEKNIEEISECRKDK
jgi:hypothetical protein